MRQNKINLDYLRFWKEIFLFLKIAFIKNFISDKTANKSGSILIVNTCLIGDFMASVLAIRDFIERNNDKKIDIVVSPPLKPLVQKIIGVRNVFVAKSVYERKLETVAEENQSPDIYEKIIVLRISPEAYRIIKHIIAAKIETGLWHFLKYGFHIGGKLIARRTPKQLREINFEMLGGKMRDIPFEEIFQFEKIDYAKVTQLSALDIKQKKIIIHTGLTSWSMKKWSDEKWIKLLRLIHQGYDSKIIFIGAKEEEASYAYISSRLNFKIYSLIGQINIAELMLVLKMSDYFIGIDSGPRNMADIAGTKSVIILGPGLPIFQPTNGKSIVIDKFCGRGLYQLYFHKKNSFISRVEVGEVYEAFKNLISVKSRESNQI
ncbi:MAG: hypothetical protein COX92_02070 [Candidatus Nealsonbacteria bacterium CG_4_10_14_0_2_um_filter_40_15]|uniref:Glycosyltransferase family 9 protein n=1 Tax=Candidatus Nealsonbacteria bacterium CG_4_10_14_0_2_um_filter_40_15 TaxID=1974682 RepID=A0A2M7UU54_9BACT|nr:MAG: hypothetical protein COX92_02070 [Candidatus Nealsonbacteria bacterium CG_4_10_14_0_2_um_filter_40_15]